MAVKTFCDFCDEEIKGDEGGVLKTLETAMNIDSTGQPTKRELVRFMCNKCIDKATKVLNK